MNQVVASKELSGLVKGSVLLSLLKYIFKELDQVQKEKFISQIDLEYKDKIIANRILPTDKVPVSMLNRLTFIASSAKGDSVKNFARNIGRFSAEEGMKSTYGIYSRIRTPNAQLLKATVIWSNLYDKGKMETVRIDKEKAIVKLVDMPTEAIMCERIYGWLERTNQLSGLQDVRVAHTKCYSFGHPYCEWEINWKKQLNKISNG
ncbi:MAG: hypothetical protein HY819_09780 [Acidobacteria bacterium]|nr:hypothetical protein [Acidobacteriota bacterium]